jgi:hypothetical protein
LRQPATGQWRPLVGHAQVWGGGIISKEQRAVWSRRLCKHLGLEQGGLRKGELVLAIGAGTHKM